jgi:homoserine kinase type II
VGTFTLLDDDDARAIARAFGLGAPTKLTSIAAGTINSNFALDTDDARWFVRVNEGKSVEDCAWEAALVVDLAAAGLPVPVPREVQGGARFLVHRGLIVSLFAWQPGRHRTPAEVSVADGVAIGDTLARMHAAASARPRSTWRDGIYQFSDIVARFEGFRGSQDPALAHAIAVLGDEFAWLTQQAGVRAAATHGVIHQDLFRDNVLWNDGRLVAVLDFEQASRGSFVYDLAVAVNDWCWDRPVVARTMIEAYHRAHALTAADRAALPVELRAAAARFTVTRITDVHLRQVDNPDKDFRAFLARLEHWRGAGLGELFDVV